MFPVLPAAAACRLHRQWLLRPPSRGMARALQKKAPSRLILSSKVADRKRDPATGGLNRTDAGFAPQRARASDGWGLNRREPNLRPGLVPREPRRAGVRSREPKPKPGFKHMKMAQSLSLVSRTQRTEVSSSIDLRDSFDEFDLLPAIQEAVVKEALADLSTVQPTPVQRLVIPALLGQDRKRSRSRPVAGVESFLIAAETGSGKTLSYLLPVIDYLKREEETLALEKANKVEHEKDTLDLEAPMVESKDEKTGRPRAVILVPTSELVNQVGALVKSLSHRVKYRSTMISREVSGKVIRSRMFSKPIDILVATPHLLSSIAETDPRVMSDVSHIIIDEADSLFDRSFSPLTSAIITRAGSLKRLILCSATIPRSLDTYLRNAYPEIQRLVTPNLHAIPRRVQLSIVDVEGDPYMGNKNLACADTLYNIAKDGTEEGYTKKVLVFVNEREKTPEVTEYLKSKGFEAIELARDTADRSTASILDYFTGGKDGADPGASGKQRMKVLVTTDIASRGVDTKSVKNVLLYDVPFSTVDFIHRLGRTGRMGRRGRAIVLVDKNTNKAWIRDIKRSMHMGGPLI